MREHQIRQCVVCRKRAHKEDLARIVQREGVLMIDTRQKLAGRGVYVHKAEACITGKFDEVRISRALRASSITRSEVRRILSEIEYVKD